MILPKVTSSGAPRRLGSRRDGRAETRWFSLLSGCRPGGPGGRDRQPTGGPPRRSLGPRRQDDGQAHDARVHRRPRARAYAALSEGQASAALGHLDAAARLDVTDSTIVPWLSGIAAE